MIVGWPNRPIWAAAAVSPVPRPLAFDAVEQRRLLAAHIGARAFADLHVVGIARTGHVGAEEPGRTGRVDRGTQRLDRVGIFGTDIDIAVGGAHGDARDGHALDKHEGVALHDHAIRERSAIAFVRVADDIFLLRRGIGDGAPLDPGGEARAAASAKARSQHLLDDRVGPRLDGPFQAGIAAMRLIVLQRTRVGDADAGEGEAGLVLEPGIVVHHADAFLVRLAGENAVVDQSADLGRLDRTVSDAALIGFDLDQGLKPVHAPGAGADDLEIEAALLGFLFKPLGNRLGAHGERARIPGNINAGQDCASLSSSSSRSSSRAA
ncbi:MAG: hypothetical protein A49_16110 [Methyloceanibacter sp.]|nr:MAG: hypothetical protein A49_16110 [Methyloceanibacter sp.]